MIKLWLAVDLVLLRSFFVALVEQQLYRKAKADEVVSQMVYIPLIKSEE